MKNQDKPVSGFSKLPKQGKISWLIQSIHADLEETQKLLDSYLHSDPAIQKLHDEFAENTLTNYFLPFGVAPNFLINGELYTIPMAIEESSVVAAASKAANFWLDRGGFKAEVISTTKVGHVHFIWEGKDTAHLENFIADITPKFHSGTDHITRNMRQRGGGILDIRLVNKTAAMPGYFQVEVRFNTCDSMGANFINSVLEEIARIMRSEAESHPALQNSERELQIVMCILSNYTPECLVRVEASCPIDQLNEGSGISNEEFAGKFARAIRIAEIEPYRAVTHNKGIMNGIDSVIIATGNDFRATEACVHAYAARNGSYSSLTHCSTDNGMFRFWMEIPLALGTVGGITSLHPMVKFAHSMLGHPGAEELMKICAVAGLAQNFSAIRSLTTTGIQKGHMKMHLLNILNQLGATEDEKSQIVEYFKDKIVSHSAAVEIFEKIRAGVKPSAAH